MPAATRTLCGLVVAVWFAFPVPALETDQYYGWGRELADSTDALNAKINLEIEDELARVGTAPLSCPDVRRRIIARFRFFIFSPLEVWAANTSLVDRIPSTAEEERHYRDASLFRNRHPLDPAGWLPTTSTVEIHGVRVGTDKLTHFFSEGRFYLHWYTKARRGGASHEEALRRVIGHGILTERTVLGSAASGVFSLADLEANYQGLRFLVGLCDGAAPQLRSDGRRWRLARRFDFRDYVTPEWDESYQPSILSRRRWREIAPVLQEYCTSLESPEVAARRARYVERDARTPTEEQLQGLVRRGKLPDPSRFAIERVCGTFRFGRDVRGVTRAAPARSGAADPSSTPGRAAPSNPPRPDERPSAR